MSEVQPVCVCGHARSAHWGPNDDGDIPCTTCGREPGSPFNRCPTFRVPVGQPVTGLRAARSAFVEAAKKADAEMAAIYARLDHHRALLYAARSLAIEYANELAKPFGWSCYLYSNAGDVLWRDGTPGNERGILGHPVYEYGQETRWAWSLPDGSSNGLTYPLAEQALEAMIEELERRHQAKP